MTLGVEVKKAIEILEELIDELEMHCNDICNATNCIDCRVHYVRDRLVEIITLLGGDRL